MNKDIRNRFLRPTMTPILKDFRKLSKEYGLTYEDISEFLKDMSMHYYWMHLDLIEKRGDDPDEEVYEEQCHTEEVKDAISEESKQDLSELQEKIAKMAIDYINSHQDVKDAIKSIQEKQKEKYGHGDVTFNFSIDNLNLSLDAGMWTPDADSYIGVYANNKNVISWL